MVRICIPTTRYLSFSLLKFFFILGTSYKIKSFPRKVCKRRKIHKAIKNYFEQ